MRIAAILLFAGSGVRTRLEIPKQFLKIGGKTVLEHTLCTFCRSSGLHEIVIVAHPSFLNETKEIISKLSDQRVLVVPGGATRQESSRLGISACPNATHVLVHDGARPLLSTTLIERVIREVKLHDAVDVCIPSPDTVVMSAGDFVTNIPNRKAMMLGQTPQAFSRRTLVEAHERALLDGINDATDDCALVMRLGVPVKIVEGERANMKLTHLDDLYLLERIFQVARLCEPGTLQQRRAVVNQALVIGGTEGIGASVTQALNSEGSEVLAVSRTTDPGVDVSSRTSITAFLDQLNSAGMQFDAIVYTPGFLVLKSIEQHTEEDWDHTYSVNLKGVFFILQRLRTLLRCGGHFLAVGSGNYSRGRARFSAYGSSKAALINLIQTAAEEYPEFRVNVVSPQRTNTGMRSRLFGVEPAATLLDPRKVAEEIIHIIQTTSTGTNFDIRIDAPLLQFQPSVADSNTARAAFAN